MFENAKSESEPLDLKYVSQQASNYIRGQRREYRPVRQSKAKVRRIAEPHLQAHRKKDGRVYYSYRRGADREIYLGDADAILKAIKGG